jgi:hypothetical protein
LEIQVAKKLTIGTPVATVDPLFAGIDASVKANQTDCKFRWSAHGNNKDNSRADQYIAEIHD